MKSANEFQSELANRILDHIQTKQLRSGSHLPEAMLCAQFNVSRTPVRAALRVLAARGIIEHRAHRGYFTLKDSTDVEAGPPNASDEEKLYLTLALDRFSRKLSDQISEAGLLRRYQVPKRLLMRVLQRMLREGLAEKRPGRGWTFAPVLDTEQAHDESYRFRLSIEPAALLEPTFKLDRERAKRCRDTHETLLNGVKKHISIIELFEMNAEFHELLAASSRNRFFLEAVQKQNQMRRFLGFQWVYGPNRALETCREHIGILTAIEEGDMMWASILLRRHLETSARLKPYGSLPQDDTLHFEQAVRIA